MILHHGEIAIYWVGGYGETISIQNPIVTGVDAGIAFFGEVSKDIGSTFFEC